MSHIAQTKAKTSRYFTVQDLEVFGFVWALKNCQIDSWWRENRHYSVKVSVLTQISYFEVPKFQKFTLDERFHVYSVLLVGYIQNVLVTYLDYVWNSTPSPGRSLRACVSRFWLIWSLLNELSSWTELISGFRRFIIDRPVVFKKIQKSLKNIDLSLWKRGYKPWLLTP